MRRFQICLLPTMMTLADLLVEEGQAMADKPGENKPGEKVTHSDHASLEKDGSPDIQKARNPNAEEVAKATKPHLGDGSLRRFNQAQLDSQNESIEIDFGGHVASRKSQLTEKQATEKPENTRDVHGQHDGHKSHTPIHLSQPARPENALHLIDVTLSTTARVLEMPFLHLAENSAINKDIANFIEHFRHDPDQFNKDATRIGGQILGIIDKPMSEDERARMIGMLIPLFFMPGSNTPLDANKVKAMNLEKMSAEELAEAGITRRVVEVYRGDNYAYDAVNEAGVGKSHLTANGDLRPANPSGEYKGRPVDIVEHINQSINWDAKGQSPYTSFSEESKGVALSFGKTHITLDLKSLRNDIASGALTDVEIIDQVDIAAYIKRSRLSEIRQQHALECSRAEHEVLIKGIIPAKYLKVEAR
ncbi:MAG: hypothetical protein WCT03_12580 [Candidatus Obscuribacterales bacterium]